MSRNGSSSPLSVCDRDCAAVNHCQVGGVCCEGCGLWFCPDCQDHGMEDGYCDECHEEIEARRIEELGICAKCAKYGTADCIDQDGDIIIEVCTAFEEE